MTASFDFLDLFAQDKVVRTLGTGEALFNKGDEARSMYIVKSGALQVGERNVVFETIAPGGLVGEMGLIDGGLRSATVVATAPTEVIEIDQSRFISQIQQTPTFAVRVMSLLASRLRAMNIRVDARRTKAAKSHEPGQTARRMAPGRQTTA
jgi:CRP/FNR family transcriptional regulator, cyclic AMP receptor protein